MTLDITLVDVSITVFLKSFLSEKKSVEAFKEHIQFIFQVTKKKKKCMWKNKSEMLRSLSLSHC